MCGPVAHTQNVYTHYKCVEPGGQGRFGLVRSSLAAAVVSIKNQYDPGNLFRLNANVQPRFPTRPARNARLFDSGAVRGLTFDSSQHPNVPSFPGGA